MSSWGARDIVCSDDILLNKIKVCGVKNIKWFWKSERSNVRRLAGVFQMWKLITKRYAGMPSPFVYSWRECSMYNIFVWMYIFVDNWRHMYLSLFILSHPTVFGLACGQRTGSCRRRLWNLNRSLWCILLCPCVFMSVSYCSQCNSNSSLWRNKHLISTIKGTNRIISVLLKNVPLTAENVSSWTQLKIAC